MPSTRRALVRACGALLAIPVAGCLSSVGGNEAVGGDGTTEQYQTGVAPGNRLTLEATGDLTVTVTMYEEKAETNRLASVDYDLDESGQVDVTEFEPSGWIVLRLDDERVWEGYVGSADHYELTIHPDGEVDEEHWVKRVQPN